MAALIYTIFGAAIGKLVFDNWAFGIVLFWTAPAILVGGFMVFT